MNLPEKDGNPAVGDAKDGFRGCKGNKADTERNIVACCLLIRAIQNRETEKHHRHGGQGLGAGEHWEVMGTRHTVLCTHLDEVWGPAISIEPIES